MSEHGEARGENIELYVGSAAAVGHAVLAIGARVGTVVYELGTEPGLMWPDITQKDAHFSADAFFSRAGRNLSTRFPGSGEGVETHIASSEETIEMQNSEGHPRRYVPVSIPESSHDRFLTAFGFGYTSVQAQEENAGEKQ